MLTAHDILPREPRPGQRAAQRRLYERFDAIVVHSAHGRPRLIEELGVEPTRVHVIPHGVLRAPGRQRAGARGARGAAAAELGREGPVVLMFGLLRPYKGIDVLLEAWRWPPAPAIDRGAELWIAGMPRMDISRRCAPLRRRACASLPRFVTTTRCSP